ncbi:MAG TPA: undecaprenyldiphospho-muramoylpentapeptide beta-N-acetylglucosaminyltransferase [Thermoanaerobaculia bacterium]|jgi:UDP-N-acetylglucosamine--N-acetylmuramyl-(pentapeptide) pyrophosphoryl-undecaprenol N-acetylglucosamine transferase
MTTLMIAGGGTGGHIYPAIAIAQEFLARDAARRVVFVGTEYGLEKTIVPRAGFPLEFISVGGLKGKGPVDLVKNLARLPLGFVQAWKLIGKHRPSVVLGVGGYSSGPVLLAAWMRRVPTLIHESNAFPGLANRALARVVTTVAVAFAEAGPRMKRKDAVVTGNPIRREFFEAGAPHPALRATLSPLRGARDGEAGVRGATRHLLIFGGSQGSHILNEAMTGALLFLARLKGRLEIVHQTGPRELEQVQSAYKDSAFDDARVVPYLDPIVDEIAAADLVVSRAGAMTIGELAAAGRAAILVPFAAATNNHQELNARVVERAGGAIVITEAQLSPERLGLAIAEVINDPDRAARMGAAARTLATPDATKKIVDLLESIKISN